MKMETAEVDLFSSRLATELASLPDRTRAELLMRIGRQELRMRSDGHDRPIWRGPVPVPQMLGADVVVPTDHGDRRGRVICFGIINMGNEYERSVVVHVPSSGTHHEAPGSVVKIASPDDTIRIVNEVTMAQRLQETVRREDTDRDDKVTPTRRRLGRDPALVAELIALTQASPNVRSIEDGPANHKVTGADRGRRLYIFKTQLRVDVSGFSFDHPGLRRISDEEARAAHLGKVRGQLIFDDRNAAIAAFNIALEGLGTCR